MLVIHRTSELPKLTVRAPAPAYRIWAVRSVVALLVVLLVVSNAALGAGARGWGGKSWRDNNSFKFRQHQDTDSKRRQPVSPGQTKSRPWGPKRPQPSVEEPGRPTKPVGAKLDAVGPIKERSQTGIDKALSRTLVGRPLSSPHTIEKQSGDNIRELWKEYTQRGPPPENGIYALPPLNKPESALQAEYVGRLTNEI